MDVKDSFEEGNNYILLLYAYCKADIWNNPTVQLNLIIKQQGKMLQQLKEFIGNQWMKKNL